MLRVECDEDSRGVMIRVVGEVGAEEAEVLRRELLAAAERRPRRLIVDGSRISYIFSDGLGALVAAHNRLREQGGRLSVMNPTPEVSELLHVTHLDVLLSVEGGAGGEGVGQAAGPGTGQDFRGPAER